MFAYLQNLPLNVSIWLIVGTGIVLFILGSSVINSIYTPDELAINNEVAGAKFTFLAQTVMTLVGFVLVDSATRFVGFQFAADREIAAITRLETLHTVYPGSMEKLRELKVAYIKSVMHGEWRTLEDGAGSPETAKALETWFRAYVSMKPGNDVERSVLNIYGRVFQEMSDARLRRISDSSSPFEFLCQVCVVIAGLITIVFCWFFGSTNFLMKIVLGGLLVGATFALIALGIVLSSPVRGDLAYTPDIYQKLIDVAH